MGPSLYINDPEGNIVELKGPAEGKRIRTTEIGEGEALKEAVIPHCGQR
jgi:hypothetical protein